jgi:hypothetical protein
MIQHVHGFMFLVSWCDSCFPFVHHQPHDWKVEQLLTVESKTLDGYVVLTFPVGELAGMKEKHSRRYHSNVPKELCAGRDDREDVNQ